MGTFLNPSPRPEKRKIKNDNHFQILTYGSFLEHLQVQKSSQVLQRTFDPQLISRALEE